MARSDPGRAVAPNMLRHPRSPKCGPRDTRAPFRTSKPTLTSLSDTIKRLGLPPVRLHDLRHGWATMPLQAGVHPKVVQERLGHANIGITLDTYSHVTAGLHDDAAETVAAKFTGARQQSVSNGSRNDEPQAF